MERAQSERGGSVCILVLKGAAFPSMDEDSSPFFFKAAEASVSAARPSGANAGICASPAVHS